jgi:hypothetical protein
MNLLECFFDPRPHERMLLEKIFLDEQLLRPIARMFHEGNVGRRGELEVWESGLGVPKDVSGATQFKVALSKLESVL